jgi:hypothetical protein
MLLFAHYGSSCLGTARSTPVQLSLAAGIDKKSRSIECAMPDDGTAAACRERRRQHVPFSRVALYRLFNFAPPDKGAPQACSGYALRRSVEASGASTASKSKADAPARRSAHEKTEQPKRKKARSLTMIALLHGADGFRRVSCRLYRQLSGPRTAGATLLRNSALPHGRQSGSRTFTSSRRETSPASTANPVFSKPPILAYKQSINALARRSRLPNCMGLSPNKSDPSRELET